MSHGWLYTQIRTTFPPSSPPRAVSPYSLSSTLSLRDGASLRQFLTGWRRSRAVGYVSPSSLPASTSHGWIPPKLSPARLPACPPTCLLHSPPACPAGQFYCTGGSSQQQPVLSTRHPHQASQLGSPAMLIITALTVPIAICQSTHCCTGTEYATWDIKYALKPDVEASSPGMVEIDVRTLSRWLPAQTSHGDVMMSRNFAVLERSDVTSSVDGK